MNVLPTIALALVVRPTSHKATSDTVENTGVEPVTSCVQGRRSSQLS